MTALSIDPVIEMLGHKAAECELKASSPNAEPWEKLLLRNRAEQYRQQQEEVLTGQVPA